MTDPRLTPLPAHLFPADAVWRFHSNTGTETWTRSGGYDGVSDLKEVGTHVAQLLEDGATMVEVERVRGYEDAS